METLLHNLSEVFAVSIIHSLWQCLIIYLLLRIFLADIVRLSSAVKYNITVTALFAATGWFIYTLFNEASHYSWQLTTQAVTGAPQHLPLITTLKEITHANERYELTIERYLPYITTVYIAGLLFHSLRLLSAWLQLQQIKQGAVPDSLLQNRLNQLSAMLNNKRAVMVSYADRIDVPCVTGYLKPLILLPLSLSTYLSAKEVEAILLHELAHVKRNDYFVNLLQQVMSVILFFNPFVLLMNRIVNQERENSCDDVVVALTGQPLVYAQALLKIEQNNVRYLPLALAATGKKFHLLNRIERIMKTKKPMANIRHVVLAFTILMGSITSIAWFNPAIGNGKLSVKTGKFSGIIKGFISDTTEKAPKSASKAPSAKKSNLPPPPKSAKVHKKNGDTYYYSTGMKDAKLDAMGKQMDEYGKRMDAYFNNPEYKKLQEQMDQTGKDMDAYYNKPELKQWQADMDKLGKNFSDQWGESAEMKDLSKQMDAAGKKMDAYYSSIEFKTLYKRLAKKYNIPDNYVSPKDDRDIKDDDYRKYKEELNKNIPADVKEAAEQLKVAGEKMRLHYNSPEYKAFGKQMTAIGDSMRRAFNNPQIKAQQEQMRKMGEQMRSYTNNPEIKKLQEQMRALGEQMRAYTNTPEFKKRMEEWKKNMKAMNWDSKFDMDHQINVEVPAVPPVPAIDVVVPMPATAPTKP